MKLLDQRHGREVQRCSGSLRKTRLGARIGTKFHDWSQHWQVGEEVQDQFMPWDDQDLRSEEEVLPLLKVKVLKESSRRM